MLVRRQTIRINAAVLLLFLVILLPVVLLSFHFLEAKHEETLARYRDGVSAVRGSDTTISTRLARIEETSRARFREQKTVSIVLILGLGLFTALFTTFVLMRRIVIPFLLLGEQIKDIGRSPGFTGRVRLESVGDFEDITAAFNRQMDLLEEKDRQLFQAQQMELAGVMAGGMAHEFNTVLTTISGFATILEKRLPPDDGNAEHIRHILAPSSIPDQRVSVTVTLPAEVSMTGGDPEKIRGREKWRRHKRNY